MSYSYSDVWPVYNTVNYYRLKQVDFNGQFEYSDIIAVKIGNTAKGSFYPNPSNGKVYFSLINLESDYLRFDLINLSGNLVVSSNAVDVNGKFALDYSIIDPGIYIVAVIGDQGELFREKLIIR